MYNETGKVRWKDVGKTMVQFSDSSTGFPTSLALDDDAKRYIKVRANHYVVTFDEQGKANTENTYYELERCQHHHFSGTPYEEKYYRNVI